MSSASILRMMPEPPMGAILYAIEVPPYVAAMRLFANQYLAYETLSDGMKKMLSGMRAVHSETVWWRAPRPTRMRTAPPRCVRTPTGARR